MSLYGAMCWVGGWDFIGMAVATWWHVIRVRCTCVCGSNNSTGISGAAVYFVWFNVFSWSLYGVGTLLSAGFFVERISLDLQGLTNVSTGFIRSY